MIRLGLAGCGKLGTQITNDLKLLNGCYSMAVFDRHVEKIENICLQSPQYSPCNRTDDLLAYTPHFLIEAASRDFVTEEIARFLVGGVSVLCLSSGALADSHVRQALANAAEAGGSKLYIPVAPPGTDAVAVLRLAGLQYAKYRSGRGTGHPLAKRGEEGVYFSGSVAQAMSEFPKSLNPAAALAEVGIGYESTITEIVFEHQIGGYEFTLEAKSLIGNLYARMTGPVGDDWTYGRWASLSTVALLNKLTSKIVVGL